MSQILQQLLIGVAVAAAGLYLVIRHLRSRKKSGCPNCAVFKASMKLNGDSRR